MLTRKLFKVTIDENGTPQAEEIKRSDEELVSLSYRHLMSNLPLKDPICDCIVRVKEEYSAIDYACMWHGYDENGEWVSRCVGLRENKGRLTFHAIAEDFEEFEIQNLNNEMYFEQLEDEIKHERIQELYGQTPKYLVAPHRKPCE